jgi:hypothetical protein
MNDEMNGRAKAQSNTRKRVHRGSGWRFMIAIPIIEASNGNRDPAWLETSRARP